MQNPNPSVIGVDPLSRTIAVIGLLVACVGIFLAWQANEIAREANTMNRPDIRVRLQPSGVLQTAAIEDYEFRACDGGDYWQRIMLSFTADVFVTNIGRSPASIASVHLNSDKFSAARIEIRELDQVLTWPLDLEPGSTHSWSIKGLLVTYAKDEDIEKAYKRYRSQDHEISLTFELFDRDVTPFRTTLEGRRPEQGTGPEFDSSAVCDDLINAWIAK